MASNLFAPPTQDEINAARSGNPSKGQNLSTGLFAPPTQDEIDVASGSVDRRGAAQAGLEHFGNGAALGYLPQLQAGANKLGSALGMDPSHGTDDALRSQGFKISQPNSYVQDRDQNTARLDQEQKDYPKASIAGDVGGSLATGIASSGLLPARAAGLAGRALQAGAIGGVTGAVSNPGDTEGEVSPLQLGDRAKNSALMASLGVPLHMAGEGMGALKGYASDALGSFAETKAAKALGGGKRAIKALLNSKGEDGIQDLGRFALDNGIVTPFSDAQNMSERSDSVKTAMGQKIGDILDSLDASGAAAPTASDVAGNIRSQAAPIRNLKTAQPTFKALSDVASDVETLGNNGQTPSRGMRPSPEVNYPGATQHEQMGLATAGQSAQPDMFAGSTEARIKPGENLRYTDDDGYSIDSGNPETGLSQGLKFNSERGQPGISPHSIGSPEITSIDQTQMGLGIPEAQEKGSFAQLQKTKKFISDQIEKSGGWRPLNPTEKNSALKDAYTSVKDQMESAAQSAASQNGDDNLLNNYTKAKSDYGNAADAGSMSTDRAAADKANRFFGLTDYISGAAGAGIGAYAGGKVGGTEGEIAGAKIGGLVGGLGNKFARTYGNQITSTSSDAISKFLAKSPDLAKLITNNPSAMPLLMASLHKNTAPEPSDQDADQFIDKFIKNPQLIDSIKDENLKTALRARINREPSQSKPSEQYIPHEQAIKQYNEGN